MSSWAAFIPSLVTTAISLAAGDAVGAATTTTSTLGPLALAVWSEQRVQKELVREVEVSLTKWAQSEHLESQLDLGVALANETLLKHGLQTERLVQIGFCPEVASNAVIEAARRADPYWSVEDHYQVAEKAIRLTYGKSLPLLRQKPEALAGVMIHVSSKVDLLARAINDLAASNAPLRLDDPTVIRVARLYLETRIKDWDRAETWLGGRSPSAISRRLRVRENGCPKEYTEEEALLGTDFLAVVASPGAGKTWLSRKYARVAAQDALRRLDDGEKLSSVEIPIWTTWSTWSARHDTAKEGLVRSSFDPTHGTASLSDRAIPVDSLITRLLTSAPIRALVVVDSLDEADSGTDYSGLLSTLQGLPAQGWRVVSTSRQEAWRETSGRSCGRPAVSGREVELLPLEGPDDVDAFVQAWFGQGSSAASSLSRQLWSRADLQEMARVPLLLAFLCILGSDEESLPTSRRDLYARVVRRLLVPQWRRPGDTDVPGCVQLLTKLAGKAAGEVDPANRLGSWSGSVDDTAWLDKRYRAIENVAPIVRTSPTGVHTRRFIHRTVLEYLVAEWLATLTFDEASSLLLPHMWFDQDWKYAAGGGVAAHPDRDLLLTRLLSSVPGQEDSWLAECAGGEIERFILTLAVESSPGDWSASSRCVIQRSRLAAALDQQRLETADLLRRTPHWDYRDAPVAIAIATALPTVDPFTAGGFHHTLSCLRPSESLIGTAIDDIGRRLKAACTAAATGNERFEVFHLPHQLTRLANTAELKRRAIDAILSAFCFSEEPSRPDSRMWSETLHILFDLADSGPLVTHILDQIAENPDRFSPLIPDLIRFVWTGASEFSRRDSVMVQDILTRWLMASLLADTDTNDDRWGNSQARLNVLERLLDTRPPSASLRCLLDPLRSQIGCPEDWASPGGQFAQVGQIGAQKDEQLSRIEKRAFEALRMMLLLPHSELDWEYMTSAITHLCPKLGGADLTEICLGAAETNPPRKARIAIATTLISQVRRDPDAFIFDPRPRSHDASTSDGSDEEDLFVPTNAASPGTIGAAILIRRLLSADDLENVILGLRKSAREASLAEVGNLMDLLVRLSGDDSDLQVALTTVASLVPAVPPFVGLRHLWLLDQWHCSQEQLSRLVYQVFEKILDGLEKHCSSEGCRASDREIDGALYAHSCDELARVTDIILGTLADEPSSSTDKIYRRLEALILEALALPTLSSFRTERLYERLVKLGASDLIRQKASALALTNVDGWSAKEIAECLLRLEAAESTLLASVPTIAQAHINSLRTGCGARGRALVRIATTARVARAAIDTLIDCLGGKEPSNGIFSLRPAFNKGESLRHGDAASIAQIVKNDSELKGYAITQCLRAIPKAHITRLPGLADTLVQLGCSRVQLDSACASVSCRVTAEHLRPGVTEFQIVAWCIKHMDGDALIRQAVAGVGVDFLQSACEPLPVGETLLRLSRETVKDQVLNMAIDAIRDKRYFKPAVSLALEAASQDRRYELAEALSLVDVDDDREQVGSTIRRLCSLDEWLVLLSRSQRRPIDNGAAL